MESKSALANTIMPTSEYKVRISLSERTIYILVEDNLNYGRGFEL